MAIQKKWEYHTYSPTGSYLGLIQNVSDPFGYNQTIGTTFVQVQITVPLVADVSGQVVSPLLDENGNQITDENSVVITDEGAASPVGDGNNNLIANNNLVQVYEISQYHPTGILVFSGYISKFAPTYETDSVLVTLISNGNDAKDYLVNGSPYVSDQSQTTQTPGYYEPVSYVAPGFIQMMGQTFETGAGVTNIAAIDIYLTAISSNTTQPFTVELRLHTTPSESTVIASTSKVFASTATAGVYRFIFTNPVTVTASTTYFFSLKISQVSYPQGNNIVFQIGIANSDAYAGGSPYRYISSGDATWDINAGYDLYFVTYSNAGATTSVYTNEDISAMLTSAINNYGGYITVPTGGYANTGNVTSYTFVSSTILQALPTFLSLAPADWYWYVDPATNNLIWKEASTTADITLIKGRHINNLQIEATKENIKNVAYFTGGDDGSGTSTNIFTKVVYPQGNNRVGMVPLSDNRVKVGTGFYATIADAVAVGQLICENYLNNNSSETYITTVVVQDGTIDTSLFNLGMMVGFQGFSEWENSLLLQIVGIDRTQPDQVTLSLGTLPLRTTKQLSQIENQLTAQQTVDNPSTPS